MIKLPLKKEKDWNFDFGIYEKDEIKEDSEYELMNKDRPRVTGLRSRYSNYTAEHERLAEIGKVSTQLAIKVEARTNDIGDLKEFYGVISEMWESMRNIFGSIVNDKINLIKKRCILLILKYQGAQDIPHKVHYWLLYYRSEVYRLRQKGNFGFEVERTNRGMYGKSRKQITE